MASFEDKVEALKRLREKRQARLAAEQADPAGEAPSAKDDSAVVPSCGRVSNVVAESEPAAEPSRTDPYAGLFEHEDTAEVLFCRGHCLENGLHGYAQDLEQAAELYRQAGEEGQVVAQWRLGELLERGRGVVQDEAEARYWYRRAAVAGHGHAQSSLALLLEEGRGGSADDVEALRWHLAAAEQGLALSQYCAACLLAAGRGGEKSPDEARLLLERSAAAGFPPAKEALEETRRACDVGAGSTNASGVTNSLVAEFPLDCFVEAHSLRMVELNGIRGQVAGIQEGRVLVDFGAPHGTKALKPINLIPVEAEEDFDIGAEFNVPEKSLDSVAERIAHQIAHLEGDEAMEAMDRLLGEELGLGDLALNEGDLEDDQDIHGDTWRSSCAVVDAPLRSGAGVAQCETTANICGAMAA